MKPSISWLANNHEFPFWALIPAAGVVVGCVPIGPKYLHPGGKALLNTLACSLSTRQLRGMVVSLAAEDPYWPNAGVASDPRIQRADGGAERAIPVLNGLLRLNELGRRINWVGA